MIIKTIGIRDDNGQIHDLFGLAVIAKREASKILHSTRFRVLPQIQHNAELKIYTVYVEFEEPPRKAKGFEAAMQRVADQQAIPHQ